MLLSKSTLDHSRPHISESLSPNPIARLTGTSYLLPFTPSNNCFTCTGSRKLAVNFLGFGASTSYIIFLFMYCNL